MRSILEFDNIVRSYTPGVPVLNGVTFSVQDGEVVGLLGRNGAGKTTLIRMAMGMLHPDHGRIKVFGMAPLRDAVAIKKRIGYVSEEQTLPTGSSIEELIAFHRYLFSAWDEELEQQILQRFDLSRNSRIARLSKGQKRSVALLCAVCHRPELLILDEPAAGLDPAARREFLEVALQLLNREKTTILFSSHYMDDVERIGARVVLLDKGLVRLDSRLDDLREDYCLAVVPGQFTENLRNDTCPPADLIHARSAGKTCHLIFRGDPETVEQQLTHWLRPEDIRCSHLTLEELFIELMGHEARGL